VKYNPKVVAEYFKMQGIPEPVLEYQFCPSRRWRFDFAWLSVKVALEVDGGIWVAGGHNRGAQIKKTWEKENTANLEGWHILKCEPKDVCKNETCNLILGMIRNSMKG
jgi:very-short-patch-repair endonuclease